MAKYKIGDFVIFEPTYEDTSKETEHTHYDFWYDNQIDDITDTGLYVFSDFDGEWDESVILGHSPDYKAGEDGVHDVRIDDV